MEDILPSTQKASREQGNNSRKTPEGKRSIILQEQALGK